MANRDILFIKANPGVGYVLGQVIFTKPESSNWSPKERGDLDANASGLGFEVVVLDLTQTLIEGIPSHDQTYSNGTTYKVNDVTTPTSVAAV